MNIKFLSAAVSILLLISLRSFAQFYDADTTNSALAEAEPAKPISLLSKAQENEINNTGVEFEDPDISYYVRNLNLSPQQLQMAQKISQDNLAKQEEIMQNISALRRQARALEINSLMAFEAILDDTQKASFKELRAGFETEEGETESESEKSYENEQNNETYNE